MVGREPPTSRTSTCTMSKESHRPYPRGHGVIQLHKNGTTLSSVNPVSVYCTHSMDDKLNLGSLYSSYVHVCWRAPAIYAVHVFIINQIILIVCAGVIMMRGHKQHTRLARDLNDQ
jgi:hypothetical protein